MQRAVFPEGCNLWGTRSLQTEAIHRCCSHSSKIRIEIITQANKFTHRDFHFQEIYVKISNRIRLT